MKTFTTRPGVMRLALSTGVASHMGRGLTRHTLVSRKKAFLIGACSALCLNLDLGRVILSVFSSSQHFHRLESYNSITWQHIMTWDVAILVLDPRGMLRPRGCTRKNASGNCEGNLCAHRWPGLELACVQVAPLDGDMHAVVTRGACASCELALSAEELGECCRPARGGAGDEKNSWNLF